MTSSKNRLYVPIILWTKPLMVYVARVRSYTALDAASSSSAEALKVILQTLFSGVSTLTSFIGSTLRAAPKGAFSNISKVIIAQVGQKRYNKKKKKCCKRHFAGSPAPAGPTGVKIARRLAGEPWSRRCTGTPEIGTTKRRFFSKKSKIFQKIVDKTLCE